MNEETREALDAQSVDMDRIKDDIRGLQEDVRLVLRKLNDMADNSSDSTVEIKQEGSQFPEADGNAETPLSETGEHTGEVKRFFGFWRDKISETKDSAAKFSEHSSRGKSVGTPAAAGAMRDNEHHAGWHATANGYGDVVKSRFDRRWSQPHPDGLCEHVWQRLQQEEGVHFMDWYSEDNDKRSESKHESLYRQAAKVEEELQRLLPDDISDMGKAYVMIKRYGDVPVNIGI